MARFAVGDLQGHLTPLKKLLAEVAFEPQQDELWLVGDLINRGPEDVEVLRYARSLPGLRVVLGNHELHMLAVAHGVTAARRKDTIEAVLEAPDAEELLQWVQSWPLLIRDDAHRQVMTHAGIPAGWAVDQATERAREIESILRDPTAAHAYFQTMYGNSPTAWSDDLEGPDRWRVITNYFTRMRFIDADHNLELEHKEPPENPPPGYQPWFTLRQPDGWQLVFGHWAALEGRTGREDCVGLDTGYGWGGWLTLYDLDRHTRHQIDHEGSIRTLPPGPVT